MVVQRPRRVLTARAAPEVFPRKEDLGPEIPRLIQGEVRVQRPLAAILTRFATVQIAPFVEQVGPETRAADRLHELLRDDRVGVDVRPVDWHHEAVQGREGIHQTAPWVTSTKRPASAAAAAMTGLTS